MPAARGDPAVLGRLREVLLGEGYADERLGAALGGTAGFGLPAFDAVSVARRLPAGPLRDLVVLFMLGGSVRRRRAGHVVGMTPAAATLAHLTVRPAGGTALDLGTGCGVEALLAAAHGAAVVATDVNERAIEFATINARLNGADGVELAAGSWFEPVAGRRFDLVVCNPPFVISPDARLVYRDGDDPADGVSRTAERQLGGSVPGDKR